MNNLSKMFLAHRQKENLSQKDMAKQLGINASILCRIEKGTDVSLSTFGKLLAWMIK